MSAGAQLLEPDPIEIDPRPCERCGYKIDQHERIDTLEGLEFFCFPVDDILTRWELDDPRDSWRHTGEPAPPASVRDSDITPSMPAAPTHYRTPQATRDAFWFVVSLCDPVRLKAWLHDHPRDAHHLLKLLETK
jgi:hypothetical protein